MFPATDNLSFVAMEDLQYPVGRYQRPESLNAAQRQAAIDTIAAAPGAMRDAVSGLNDAQLDTPYRPEGWTVRQVVHHVPDSHMNAYIRFKLALTEAEPTIKPYQQQLWAELADTRQTPIETSLILLECLHQRWVLLLKSMAEADWQRTFRHPELGIVRLDTNLALYAWHGRHHVAHITGLRERMKWGSA